MERPRGHLSMAHLRQAQYASTATGDILPTPSHPDSPYSFDHSVAGCSTQIIRGSKPIGAILWVEWFMYYDFLSPHYYTPGCNFNSSAHHRRWLLPARTRISGLNEATVSAIHSKSWQQLRGLGEAMPLRHTACCGESPKKLSAYD